ncbi:hypothetical protein BC829DRAFT_488592 [Chytridium lagenaria]|nr:hypothetical protein BC829DRAFT_488592 [Chytridium lagenaria]
MSLSLNSTWSLIIGSVCAALSIVSSAFVFFSGYSTVRAIASIAFFVLERADSAINTAQSGSVNVWGFCLYLDRNQNGDYQCTALSVAKIFAGSFSLQPSITIPQRSGAEIVRIQDVINVLPFQGHPIAYATLLSTMFFAGLAIAFSVTALMIKEKYLKGWGLALNAATLTSTLSLLSSVVNLILTAVTTSAFVSSINANTSTLGITAKWGIIGTALTATTAFLSILACSFITRASMIGQTASRKSRYLSGLGMNPDRFKDTEQGPNAAVSPSSGSQRPSAFDDNTNTFPTTSTSPQTSQLDNSYHTEFATSTTPGASWYNTNTTTYPTAPQQYPQYTQQPQQYYGNYNYNNQAYTTAAAAGTSDYNYPLDQATTIAPSTYLSNQTGSTNNQYSTWQSAGYNPTTAEASYQQNYGHNVADTSYYGRRQQQGQQPQQQNY